MTLRFDLPYMTGAHPLFVAGSLLAAGSAHAGTSSPFDPVPLLITVFLYFLCLLGCLVMSIVSRRTGLWLTLLIAGIGIPVAVFYAGGAVMAHKHAQRNEEIRQGEMKNTLAFAAYCKARKRTVRAQVIISPGSALLIQIEKDFPVGRPRFNASPLHGYMTRERQAGANQKWCERSNLSYLVGRYDEELVQFEMCSIDMRSPFIGEMPRYALILGESVDKKPAPWHGDQNWMATSSVSLIDRKSGAVLATDTMYFLRNDEHSTACPNGNEQLASLITDVFPKQSGRRTE
jgi:hypothetical protein